MSQWHGYKRPWAFESVTKTLDIATSPGALAIAIAAVYYRFRGHERRHPSWLEVQIRYPWLSKLVIFVALKTLNRIAIRLALNRGWRRSPPDWDKEIVVVTGGAGGIGNEIVKMLLRAKPRVRIAVFDLAEPKDRPRTMNVRYYRVNIVDPESISSAAKEIREEWGPPTMLVNNAGIMRSKTILDLTAKEFAMTIRVNVVGAFNIIHEFLPDIAAADHGHIVTVASTAAFASPPSMSDYSASKAGVLSLHEVLTAELYSRMKALNVKTTCICPIKVDTPLGTMVADHKDQIMTPTLKPWQVAERIVKALDSGLSGGTVFVPSFIWTTLPLVRALPPWYSWFVSQSQGLADFATDTARKAGAAGGYRILVDDEQEK